MMQIPHRRFAGALLLPLVLLVAAPAQAEIYKCRTADGQTEFRNMPCEAGAAQEVLPERQPTIVPSVPVEEAPPPERRNRATSNLPEQTLAGVRAMKTQLEETLAAWNLHFVHLVLLVYLLMSLVSFFSYRHDKQVAITDRGRRIPERTLHWQEMLGGWPGALLAQKVFRHKTIKPDYQFTFWTIVFVHVLLWADAVLGFPALGALIGFLR